MIHKFAFDDKKLVLDVHSSTLHEVDELTYELLEDYDKCSRTELIDKYQQSYDAAEIKEALAEIKELVDQQLLYSPDPMGGKYTRPKGLIKALCLHVAHDCNMRCRYCFAGQGPFGGDRSLMSAEIGKKAIDFVLTKSGPRKQIEIDFFGGEPLMNFPVVQELVTYGREKSAALGKVINFTLTTNAFLLNEKIQQYLADNYVNVVLSLDGRKEVHDRMRPAIGGKGTYDVVMKNIKSMIAHNPPAGYYVRGTYTRYNKDFSHDVMHFVDQDFVDISVEPVVASPADDYALRPEDLPEIKQEYAKLTRQILEKVKEGKEIRFYHYNLDLDGGPCIHKRLSGCGAGNEYLAVTPDGELYPCHQFVGQKEFCVGHVDSLELNETILDQFRVAHVYNKPECNQCWAKFYCSGGCHANAYNFNKDLLQPYQMGCEIAKARLEQALYIQTKLREIGR